MLHSNLPKHKINVSVLCAAPYISEKCITLPKVHKNITEIKARNINRNFLEIFDYYTVKWKCFYGRIVEMKINFWNFFFENFKNIFLYRVVLYAIFYGITFLKSVFTKIVIFVNFVIFTFLTLHIPEFQRDFDQRS